MSTSNRMFRSVAACGLMAMLLVRCGDDDGGTGDGDGAGDGGTGGDAGDVSGAGGAAGDSGAAGEGGSGPGPDPGGGGTTPTGSGGTTEVGGGTGGTAVTAGRGGTSSTAGSSGTAGTGEPGGTGSSGEGGSPPVGGDGGKDSGGQAGSSGSDNGGAGGNTGGDGGTANGGGGSGGEMATGESCANPFVVTTDTLIEGTSFSADFGDDQEFTGESCELAASNSPEAVFAIDVPAGSSVLLRETSDGTGVGAVLSLMRSCSNASACVASRPAGSDGWDNVLGLLYTAEEDETLFASVAASTQEAGPYQISIDYPTSLGTFDNHATVPVVNGGALADGAWKTYLIDVTEPAFLYGTLARTGTEGDVDINLVWTEDSPVGYSVAEGDDTFAFPAPIGQYRLEVGAFEAVTGSTLNLFTDPVLPIRRALGDDFDESHDTPILEGRSYFYYIRTDDAMDLTISVDADSGDPDLWLYHSLGALDRKVETPGSVESITFSVLPDDVYTVRVLASPGGGDISSHTLSTSTAAPPTSSAAP